jgi:hypothetical protein
VANLTLPWFQSGVAEPGEDFTQVVNMLVKIITVDHQIIQIMENIFKFDVREEEN